MVIGVLQIALRLPEVHSLKEKRWILKSLVTRIHNQFNVSVSEVDFQDSWQQASVAVAHVGNDRNFANRLLDQVLNFTGKVRGLEVVDSQMEFY